MAIQANKGRVSKQEISEVNKSKVPSDDEIDSDFQKNAPQEDVKDEEVAKKEPAKVQADIDVQIK